MRFSLFHTVQDAPGVDPSASYQEAVTEIVAAEELGFSAVWLTEHHFSAHGIISDSLNLLSHLAARTSRIRLGTAVAVLPFHHPVRLAESAAMVDVLSGGRLDFGVGRGYQWAEFNGFQVDMEQRAARFDEALEVILRSWTATEPFEHQGRFWQTGSIEAHPRPVQSPHPPVWVATDSEDGLRRCAERGFGVLLPQGSPLSVVEQQVERYRSALDAAGVEYDPAKLGLARAAYVADSDDEAWEVAGKAYGAFVEGGKRAAAGPAYVETTAANPFDTESIQEVAVFGAPDTCVEHLDRIAALGVEQLLVFFRFSGLGHDRIMRSLERFSTEVAPEIARARPIPAS